MGEDQAKGIGILVPPLQQSVYLLLWTGIPDYVEGIGRFAGAGMVVVRLLLETGAVEA